MNAAVIVGAGLDHPPFPKSFWALLDEMAQWKLEAGKLLGDAAEFVELRRAIERELSTLQRRVDSAQDAYSRAAYPDTTGR